MVRLAVVCSLLPARMGAARYARALLPHLAERAEVTLLVPDPHQLPLADEQRYRVAPLADLGHLLDSGQVDVPVYVFGAEAEHLGQLRWLAERPGIAILVDHTAHGCIAAQTLDAGFEGAYRERVATMCPDADADGLVAALRQGGDRRAAALAAWPMLVPWVRDAVVVAGIGAGAAVLAEQLGRPVERLPLAAPARRWDRATARAGLGLADAGRIVAWAGPGARPIPGCAVLVRGIGPETSGVAFLDEATFDDLAVPAADGGVVAATPWQAGVVPQTGAAFAAHGIPVLTDVAGGEAFGRVVAPGALDGALDAFVAELDPQRTGASSEGPDAVDAAVDAGAAAAQVVGWANGVERVAHLRSSRPRPKVEAMVLAYKSKHYIEPCIQSLLDQDYPNLAITVIDNASGDGTGEFLREKYPTIKVVISEENLGFAGGNNALFDASDADYFALLNHDATARRDWVTQMVAVAELDEGVGIVGAKMMMRRCPTIINSTGIAMNEGGFAADRQIGERDVATDPTPEQVFGACGGAVLFRGRTIRELGGFDATFFMYFEDVDLCWRLGIAGRKVYYNPAAVVVHDWHGDMAADNDKEAAEKGYSARMERRRFLCERNRVQCVVKNYEFGNLRKVWKELRRFEKIRLGWCDNAIRSGNRVGYFAMVRRAIKRAYRWNLQRLPGVWRRRRKAQALRVVPDSALEPLIARGVGEPSHIGDLDSVRDRYSVDAVDRLVVGVNDQQSLGSGWFPVEPVPDQEWDVRWTKDEAWFYLRPASGGATLCVRVVPQPRPTTLTAVVNGIRAGSLPVAGKKMEVLRFALLEPLAAGDLVEGRLQCGTFCPAELHGGDDRRELGVHLAEIWVE